MCICLCMCVCVPVSRIVWEQITNAVRTSISSLCLSPLLNHCFYYLSHSLSVRPCVQECAAGFYRLRPGSLASAPASRVPTAAGMGSCVQCQCSGHSSTCDPETSICQVNECVCVCAAAGDPHTAICQVAFGEERENKVCVCVCREECQAP